MKTNKDIEFLSSNFKIKGINSSDKEVNILEYNDDVVSLNGNAATATSVKWSGVTEKPTYYDSKAIKSITRDNLTFTYTYMDGTTGTFDQKDTVYTHPEGSGNSKEIGLYKFSTDDTSHIKAVENVTKSDITELGIPAQDTTYSFNSGITYGTFKYTPSSGSEAVVTINGFDDNGNLTLTDKTIEAATFKATSDKRLKENITPYSCEKSILDLPVYKYNFIKDETKKEHIGCLAQDLQEICPDVVDEGKDGYLSIQESKLVYLLLEEVKKLKEEIKELKEREA